MQYRNNESVTVGGFPLVGTLNGSHLQVGELSGWWERPSPKRSAISRELSDGDFPVPWHYDARYITITGRVKARSHEDMHHVIEQLNGLAATRREWLSVQGHGVLQSAMVEADDSPVINLRNPRLMDFTLFFKANDPRKYGELRTASVGHDWTTLRQYGNYPAVPSFRLRAVDVDDSGYQLSGEYPDGERRVWWYFYWVNGGWHQIDYARGTHFVESTGEYRPDRVRYSETFEVPPQSYVRVRARDHSYDADFGPGQVTGTVSWRDTWI